MKLRGAAIQGALAAGALLAAYVTWQSPSRPDGRDVVVLDASRRDVERIRYEDERGWTEVRRGEKDAVWVVQGEKTPPPDAAQTAHAAAPAEQPPRTLKGNEVAAQLFDSVSPLRASRSLGVLDEARLAENGLASTERRLELTVRGQVHGFRLARAPGSGSTYLQDEKGRVFLTKGSPFADLENAKSRLVDRRLHAFEPDDFDALTVRTGERAGRYVVAAGRKLAPAKTPEVVDDFASNWHDKLWRLPPAELLGVDEAPPGGEPVAELRVDYTGKGAPRGWMEIARSGSDLYARSGHTAGWVKLGSAAGELLTEGAKVARAAE